jgi:4-amino-4-deoxy-L-arabinose transferase-like glycosyltransferase
MPDVGRNAGVVPETGGPASPAGWRVPAAVALVLLSGVLIFARLGHYPLWDDEATTAMFGRNVLATGDTSAVVGHNIIAYRGGHELVNLKLRYLPPLQYWAVAGGAALFGNTNFAARFPFALAGLLTVGLTAWWMVRRRADPFTWAGLSAALLGNVSLILFSRQCRYYGLAIFFSTLAAYLYVNWNGKRRGLLLLSAASLALLASNYLNLVALFVVLAVDYLLWRRKEQPLGPADWATLLVPLLALGLPIVAVFNPLGKGIVGEESVSWIVKRGTLLWWHLRDLNGCELGVGLLLAAAPLLRIWIKDHWLGRAALALAVYIMVITLISPQPVSVTYKADVRYLVPVIPLCAFIGVRVIRLITKRRWLAGLPLMLLCFGTNLVHGTWTGRGTVRSTLAQYVGELIRPQRSPFGETAAWIRRNVPARANVWVVPDYMLYPLMLYAPEPVYGYQLRQPVDPQFAGLPDVHVIGRVPPDYVVCFGPRGLQELRDNLQPLARMGARYEQVGYIDVAYRDTTRPELFWHEFKTVTEFNTKVEGVYVYRRSGAPTVGQ